nr:hypothetical protein [Angustibacter aerolatus]
MPFATEEAWSWWQAGSVHRAAWPAAAEVNVGGDPLVLPAVGQALAGLRGVKSTAKVSQRTEVLRAVVTAPAEQAGLLQAGLADLRAAGRVRDLEVVTGGDVVTVTESEPGGRAGDHQRARPPQADPSAADPGVVGVAPSRRRLLTRPEVRP